MTCARAKSSPTKTAKKKTPKYRKFKPIPGANLCTELIRLGRSVGGVNLELPSRGKPRTSQSGVIRAEVKSSSAKTAKKKTPKYRKFKPIPGANLCTELIRLGRSVGGVDLELPTRSRPHD